jgi:sugar lactone lactonase YvrE
LGIQGLAREDKWRSRGSRRLVLEPLEDRALMSCSVQPYYVVFDPRTHAGATASASLPVADVAPLSSSSPTGLTPAQIRAAYGINSIVVGSIQGDGTGQTIAIVDAYDDPDLRNSSDPNFSTSDLHQFDVRFGLADPPSFRKVGEDGSTNLAAASGSSGWSIEESLDVEWAHAVAPGASIVLVEADDPSNTSIMAAVNTARNLPGVSVVSMSFGSSEYAGETACDSTFTTPGGHTGVTFVASTGDSGAPGGYPAYSANVLAVGGTTLGISGNSSYTGETAWSGSGGGQSTQETEPGYQGAVQTSGWRQIPDVAFDADPASGVAVYDSYDCGSSSPWIQVGGTSLAAPCWGGLLAIADQLRAAAGRPTLDGASLTMSKIYSLSAGDFHDITSGSNGGFVAGPGYDEVTGRGSPVANLLVPDLAALAPSQGAVAFTARQYLLGSTATITLRDGDLSGDPTCTVTATSTAGDSENVTLTAIGDGYFQGTIATSAGSAVPGDGILETTTGINAISVVYHDADDGTGHAANPTVSASVYTPLTLAATSPASPIAINHPYSLAMTASGGVGADSWSVSGSLPPGLSINRSTGVLSGTPTAAGNYRFVVTVADAGAPQSACSQSLDIVVGTVADAVATTATKNSCHKAGDSIQITVTFGQAVTVSGTPQIALNAGKGASAIYVSGSGSATLVFNYIVAAGQTAFDLDYVSTASLSGGSIRDLAGNAANPTLPPTGFDGLATSGIIIAPLPTTGSLTAATSTTAAGGAKLVATFITNPPTGVMPTGTVDFVDLSTGSDLGQATLLSGTATLNVAGLASGTHVFVAHYLGNAEFLASTSVPLVGPTSLISNVAGGGSGDNVAATASALWSPSSVAVDAAGNIYIADGSQGRVRRVDHVTGIITTVAGNGGFGDSGDGGQATAAALCDPTGIALDANGNLYITEPARIDGQTWVPYGARIRKVNLATGLITTVAGDGQFGYSGDGAQATAAMLYEPAGIVADAAGDLFFADLGDQCVREVNHATGLITTVAGTGTAGYSGDGGQATAAMLSTPNGVALDCAGNLLIADSGNDSIRKVSRTTGLITTVVGNGTAGYSGDGAQATAATLNDPLGVAVDACGNLLIADAGNNCIREVSHATGTITTIVGTGGAGYGGDGGQASAAMLYGPAAVGVDSTGDILIADGKNNRIREVNHGTGLISTIAGNGTISYGGDGGQATAAMLNDQDGLALDAAGDLFIADYGNNCIREVNHATGVVTTVTNEAYQPCGVAVDAAGDLFYADTCCNCICEVNHATGAVSIVAGTGVGGYSGDGGQATAAELCMPWHIALDAAGDLFIADAWNGCIREVSHATGIITTVAGNGVNGYAGDGGQATAAELCLPRGIAVDALGNLYIADTWNSCVREVSHATGVITTIAGCGAAGYSGDGGQATAACLDEPYGLTLDNAGNLFIADSMNSCIRKVNLTTGLITTVAGTGQGGASGNGGQAGSATLFFPTDVVVDSAGNLLISDHFNSMVRKVAAAAPQLTVNTAVATVSVSDAGGVYNGSAFAATPTVAGTNGVRGASLEGVGLTLTYFVGAQAAGTGSATAPSAVGTYTVVASFAGSVDYLAAHSAPLTFTIRKATATVVVNDAGGSYQGSGYAATATVAGVNGAPAASLEGAGLTLTYYVGAQAASSGSATAPSATGTYTVVAFFAGSADYSATQSAAVTFSIRRATATVAVYDAGGAYKGSGYAATAALCGANGAWAASLEGVGLTLTYYVGAQAGGSGSAAAPSAAGTYSVVASFAGSADYAAAQSAPLAFTISKATPMVSVADAGGTYNRLARSATAKLTGVNGVAAATLEGVGLTLTYYVGTQATGPGSAAAPSAAGTYTVTASFAGSADYLSTSGQTTFTINRATLTVSGVTASNKTYDGTTAATLNTHSAALVGVAAGDAVTLVAGAVTGAFAAKDPGAYTVQVSGYSLSGAQASNYVLAQVTASASITAKALTISAANASKTFGFADPAFSVTYAGFVAGEGPGNLNGHLTLATTETSPTSAAPGQYRIIPSGLSSQDYAITFVSGALTVSKAQSSVAAGIVGGVKVSKSTALCIGLSAVASGSGTPSGTVTLLNAANNAVLGNVALSQGLAAFTGLNLVNVQTITVEYSGDADFAASVTTIAVGNLQSAAESAASEASRELLDRIHDLALLEVLTEPTSLVR